VRARRECIGAALIIGELNEDRLIVELFDDCADPAPILAPEDR